jgi:hypothetical protein
MKARKMAIILAGLALLLFGASAAQVGVQVMDRHDCQVMEEHLARESYQVMVEAGMLIQAGGEVQAFLQVRLPSGVVREMRYSLGATRSGQKFPSSEKDYVNFNKHG